MPAADASIPRMMFPAPITSATSRPLCWTSTISSASAEIWSASTPWSRSPISASPESFSRTRWNGRSEGARSCACAVRSSPGNGHPLELDHLEPALLQPLPDGLRGVVDPLLLEQDLLREPLVEAAFDHF